MKTQADKVIEFVETFCTLTGSFSGQPFILKPWMKRFIRAIFATREDGRRKHRTFILSIARKNAKSTLGAAIALYMLIADDSDGEPLIVSAAGDRAQAKMVFDMAKKMVEASPELSAVCKVYRNEIKCTLNGGLYMVVSSDAGRAHGLNPSCVLADELHVWPNDDLYVALNSGSAARNQPLTLVMSTPGYDMDSPFGRLVEHGRRVNSGEIDDTSFGMLEFGPPENLTHEEYGDPKLWEECNPSWEFMNHEEMESNYKLMTINDFIRFRLGGWTKNKAAWLPPGAWEDLKADKTIMPGDAVILSLDAAWKHDSTALVATRISDKHQEVVGLWESPVDDPHWRTPQQELRDTILEAIKHFDVRELVCDPWRAEILMQDIAEMEIVEVVEFATNSMARMVPATADYYGAVIAKELSHDGDPALARHIGNCVLKEDSKGARVTKEYKSSGKYIDLAIAAIIGHQRACLHIAEPEDVDPELFFL